MSSREDKRMKKENRMAAQQRRAEERKKQEQRKKLRKHLPLFIPLAVAAVILVIIAVSAGQSHKKQADGQEETQASVISETEDARNEAGTEAASTEAEGTGDYARFDSSSLEGAYDISKDKLTYAQIKVKDYGTITIALDSTVAPETVKNFVSLAESGFYDGLTFHRIMDGFMIQGGDPLGDGTGGSDETIRGEFSANGVENPITHVRGAVSMARSQDMDSASSQFFIVQSDSTFLDGQYAGFGYVTDGMDIVDQICKDAKPTDDNGTVPADQQPVIEAVKILQ